MIDEAFYWIFCAVIVAVIVIKSGKPKAHSILAYLVGAALGVVAAFAVGYIAERTNPLDILLLRPAADIYSIFLISIVYGMLVRAVLWVVAGSKTDVPSPN